jgi:glycine/D-amino acid oxidase-like deaminating enzyme
MSADILHPEFRHEPYWHDAAPRRNGAFAEVPRNVDVLIIGSGYTGMSAARTLAKAGREVVVLDAARPGDGASSRNAGYLGTLLLTSFSKLRRIVGLEKALAAYAEAKRAFDFTVDLIQRESIDCSYEQHGRIYWAYTKSQLEGLKSELADLQKYLGKEGRVLGPDHASGESGSRHYCGGILLPETGALHAGKWHDGLMGMAETAGATVIGNAAVERIASKPHGHDVSTGRGKVHAREVIVATDGYVGKETPALRRRIVPVSSQMVATEQLPAETVRQILPTQRTNLDVRSIFQYWRLSPDRTRLLFGGRTGLPDRDPVEASRALHQSVVALFPQLEGKRITHYWSGKLGFTYDRRPHIGTRDGIHFAMGMNGAGVAMGTYIGHCMACRLMGHGDGDTLFAQGKFAAIPLYTGRPWFVPMLSRLANVRHRLELPPR